MKTAKLSTEDLLFFIKNLISLAGCSVTRSYPKEDYQPGGVESVLQTVSPVYKTETDTIFNSMIANMTHYKINLDI